MRLDVNNWTDDCAKYIVIDKETGLEIPNCTMADDEIPEYKHYTNEDQRHINHVTGVSIIFQRIHK